MTTTSFYDEYADYDPADDFGMSADGDDTHSPQSDVDVDGGIAACTDAHKSPYAPPGELCRSAKFGLCLVCPNAVLMPEHIAGLQRFDAEVIEDHRKRLGPPAFAQRWLPIRGALRWALAQLGAPTEESPK